MAITQENISSAIYHAIDYGASKLLLLGSALDDPQNANDLNLGIEVIEPSKFFLFGADLEDIIMKTVDLVPLEFNSSFVNHIKKYWKYIYESSSTN